MIIDDIPKTGTSRKLARTVLPQLDHQQQHSTSSRNPNPILQTQQQNRHHQQHSLSPEKSLVNSLQSTSN